MASEGTRVSIFRTALGATTGVVDFHVSEREDSSSVLEIGERQIHRFPGTAEKSVVSVPLETLDDALAAERLIRPCLLKVDVQGYEFEVLQGATQTLREVDEILVELSFAELYVGQHLAADVIEVLTSAGFSPVGIHNVVSGTDGPLQADFHFARFPPTYRSNR